VLKKKRGPDRKRTAGKISIRTEGGEVASSSAEKKGTDRGQRGGTRRGEGGGSDGASMKAAGGGGL